MTTTNTPERATARKWFWSGDSLMEDWPDKGCSHHILHARKDGTLFVEEGAQERIIEAVNTHDALQAENERLRERVKALEPDIAWLRTQAVSTAKAMTMLQEHRTADYKSRGDLDANYKGIETHETREWQLAEKLSALLTPQEPNNG